MHANCRFVCIKVKFFLVFSLQVAKAEADVNKSHVSQLMKEKLIRQQEMDESTKIIAQKTDVSK